jgi:cysteine dioxygenase
MKLAELLQKLRSGARGMKLPDLQRLVEELRPEYSEIAPHIHFKDERYTRNLIERADDFEALLLCWRAGQRSPIHDHANSMCAVYTVQGQLSAENYRLTPAGHIRPDSSEEFQPGAVLSIEKTEIHQVSNLQGTDDLITLHFYLGPLEKSRIYGVGDIRRGRRVA